MMAAQQQLLQQQGLYSPLHSPGINDSGHFGSVKSSSFNFNTPPQVQDMGNHNTMKSTQIGPISPDRNIKIERDMGGSTDSIPVSTTSSHNLQNDDKMGCKDAYSEVSYEEPKNWIRSSKSFTFSLRF